MDKEQVYIDRIEELEDALLGLQVQHELLKMSVRSAIGAGVDNWEGLYYGFDDLRKEVGDERADQAIDAFWSA